MNFEDLGLLFFTSLILSLLLTPASISFAKYIGAVDSPVGRSVHTTVMPRMGGLGMAIAVVVALMLFLKFDPSLLSLLVGALMIVLTGVFDDVVQISPAKKMLGQIVACVAFLYLSGLSIASFGDLLAMGSLTFPDPINLMVTLFCMLGIINAFNLSDGLDGLAAGITLIAAVFMAMLALLSQNWFALFVIVALIGSVLGFLKFNSHPAKLFMGDTGSLSLGFFVSCLVVCLVDFEGKVLVQPVTLALILALPISDTLIVMTTRILKGQSPVSADKTHFHHRLLDIGLSHSAVVVLI
ncbi:MAG: MraY family glycosyltransferase, partial [Ghiorsea sp.]